MGVKVKGIGDHVVERITLLEMRDIEEAKDDKKKHKKGNNICEL